MIQLLPVLSPALLVNHAIVSRFDCSQQHVPAFTERTQSSRDSKPSSPMMFVTIIVGDEKEELLNPNCQIKDFILCLKRKCNLDPQETVDLMDKTGELVNLVECESTNLARGLLKERGRYIPLRVCVTEDTEEKKYSALCDSMTSFPELTEFLKKLSMPSKERDRRARGPKLASVSQIRSRAPKIITAP